MEQPLIIFATSDRNLRHWLSDSAGRINYDLLSVNQMDASSCLMAASSCLAMAIIDLEWEGTDFSFLKELRKSNPGLPILVVANNVDALAQREDLARMATDYLLKPVDPEELGQKIQELFRERAPGFNELSFHAPRAIFHSNQEPDPGLAVWLKHGEEALVSGPQ